MCVNLSEEARCFEKLKQAIIEMEEEKAAAAAREILSKNYALETALKQGMIAGMDEVSRLYDEEEYFIPDLLSCADAMYAALEILSPHLKKEMRKKEGTIIIGSIEGDTHDIGKNIVALFLEGAGFEVINLGRDVSAERFVRSAVAHHADIIIISTLMTTTMIHMKKVIDLLEEKGMRKRFQVMVGGKPVSIKFARDIGADGYSADAKGAVRTAKRLMKVQRTKEALLNAQF